MARRKAKLDLTLFPFLSVLSGLIAVNVLLMIVTISTRVISPEIEAVQPEAGEGGDAADDAAAVANGIDAATHAQLESQITVREAALEERRIQRAEIRLQMREIASLITAKEIELQQNQALAVPKIGKRIGEPTPIRVIPAKSPDGIVRKAVFIEVNSTGYIVHPEKTAFPIDPAKKTPKGELEVPAGMQKVFAELAASKDNRYPLFLIHPNGANVFQAALEFVSQKHRGLKLGWEPFSRELLLDSTTKKE